MSLNTQCPTDEVQQRQRLHPGYFYFPLEVVLCVNGQFQTPSESGFADLQRSRRAPGHGGVWASVGYLSETSDFLQRLRDIDSACHESIAGRFYAMLSRKSAWQGAPVLV